MTKEELDEALTFFEAELIIMESESGHSDLRMYVSINPETSKADIHWGVRTYNAVKQFYDDYNSAAEFFVNND